MGYDPQQWGNRFADTAYKWDEFVERTAAWKFDVPELVFRTPQLKGPPRAVGLTLYRKYFAVDIPADKPQPLYKVRARIRYGVGSIERTVECDWRGQLVIHCTRLEVEWLISGHWVTQYDLLGTPTQVPNYSSYVPGGPSVYDQIFLGAVASLEPSACGEAPTWTQYPTEIPAGGFANFPVPALARSVHMIPRSEGEIPVDEVLISFRTFQSIEGSELQAALLEDVAAGLFGPDGLPIPSGTAWVQVVNQSAAPFAVGLVYELGIG